MIIVIVVLINVILYSYPGILSGRLSFHMVQNDPQVKFNIDLSPRDYHSSFEHGYVTALLYSGQQGTGIQALMSLQCFVGSFNLPMYIVEPVMINTSFGSRLKLTSDNFNSILKFSDLFDFSHFNNASRKMEFTEIRSENDFYTNAPTKVILVESHRSNNMHPATVAWTSQEEGNCYSSEQIAKEFCIVRVISVSGKRDMRSSYQIFSKEELFSIVFGPWLPKDVTLVFRQWHTPWYVSNPSINNPFKCKDIRTVKPEIQFHASSKLLSDVERYQERFLGSKNRLAIMFRLERMMILLMSGLKHGKESATMDFGIRNCLREVERVVNDVWNKKGFLRPLVTLDVGKYGSKSWRNRRVGNLTREINSTLSFLFQNKWTFSEWGRKLCSSGECC